MSHDLIRNYIVKIEAIAGESGTNSKQGTGVIFKSNRNSQVFYIITAKHIFENLTDHILATKKLENIKLNVFLESNNKQDNIIKNNVSINIPNNNKDIALIIIKREDLNIHESKIHYLEFFDMDDNFHKNSDFFISGYPAFMNGARDLNSHLMSYTIQHLRFEENDDSIALLNCTSTPTLNPNMGRQNHEMGGISGAGIFIRENKNIVRLSHIQHNIMNNVFYASRVDLLLDDLNDIIVKENQNFPIIQTSTKVIIDDMNIYELPNFDFIKRKIETESTDYMEDIKTHFDYARKLEEINSKEKILKANKTLQRIHNDIESLSKALSCMYANYAIIAHQEKSRRLTTLLFRKAIRLNPEYEVAFLQEKARRENNFETLKEIATHSLEDTIKFYDEELNNTKENNMEHIKVVKEVIHAVIKFEKNNKSSPERIKYFPILEKAYKNNHTIREAHKYKELGEFYLQISENTKALEQLYISLFIFEESPKTEANQFSLSKIRELIENIAPNENIEQIKEIARSFSEEILEQEEDKNIKDQLNKTNAMLSVIYDDIYHIKLEENNKKQLNSRVVEKLHSLTHKVGEQIDQNTQYNLNTIQINEAISTLDVTTINLTENIKNMAIQHELKDEETRKEILTTVQRSSDEINHAIDDLNTQSVKVANAIDNHLDNLTTQENTLLKNITNKFDEKLQEISIHQKNIVMENREVLIILKNSEKRMLSGINKLHLTSHQRDASISLIQQSISQLQANAKLAIAKGKFHKKTESNTDDNALSFDSIKQTCIQLEDKITRLIKEQHQIYQETTSTLMTEHLQDEWLPLTKQALLAHAETASSIKSIHSSQNRFEHSLLNKTVEALHKHEEINTKNHWTFRKKVLFFGLMIIAVSATITFLIRQGHLDFLIPLWQTALQQLNP